jgi:hypothetical protein
MKDFPFEGTKLTNAYFLDRVSKDSYPDEIYWGKPIDWNIKEENIIKELNGLKAEPYSQSPHYVNNVGADYADIFYVIRGEEGDPERMVILSYGWPFKFETAWLTSERKSILETKGIPLESIKENYELGGRKYNAETGELIEDYVLGDEGFRLLYKKSPELTQRQMNEAKKFLEELWKQTGGYKTSYNEGDTRDFYERQESTLVDFEKLFGIKL